MELTDGTNVLAKARALKEAVDHQRRGKIPGGNPSSQPRAVPQAEDLVRPEIKRQQTDGNPFRTQLLRPAKARLEEAPRQIAWERKGASHAEQVPRREQTDYSKAAP